MAEIKAKAKTIGMKVPPVLYTKLKEAKGRLGIKTMKEVALRSCVAGVHVLLSDPARDELAGYPHMQGDRWEREGSRPVYVDSTNDRGGLRLSNGETCWPLTMGEQGWTRTMSVFFGEMQS